MLLERVACEWEINKLAIPDDYILDDYTLEDSLPDDNTRHNSVLDDFFSTGG